MPPAQSSQQPSWWRRWLGGVPNAEPQYFTRWPRWRRWFGHRCERAVASHLWRLGYTVLAANVQAGGAEIDLLVLDRDTLVIVEVRSTQASHPGALMETAASVHEAKQEKLTRGALAFLKRHRLLGKMPVRFDVIGVAWPPNASYPLIHHIPDAFPAQGKYQFFC
ncbi:MAG: YraN family protein [Gemmataceae bacterium]|nr:YraN family protein [Gemmataceae bacterium]MCS7269534.1 YraN family protein [Gemmataceae bacterium]MDW8243932.1 YraN family protein [Thermogemmata sp.]